ncbi:hypothetical protein ACTNDZ_13605, partial [Selenomonas montiformis]|uniref:hypothetical protein n=1 Tax=Selenomonas montiformis TaxID=2652285 RepID=UPI003F888D24
IEDQDCHKATGHSSMTLESPGFSRGEYVKILLHCLLNGRTYIPSMMTAWFFSSTTNGKTPTISFWWVFFF